MALGRLQELGRARPVRTTWSVCAACVGSSAKSPGLGVRLTCSPGARSLWHI